MLRLYKKNEAGVNTCLLYTSIKNEIKKKFINRTSFGDTLETIQMNSPHFKTN